MRSGAGSGLVEHEAAEKAVASKAARDQVTKEFLGDVAEEAVRGDAGPLGKKRSSSVACRCGSAGRRLSSTVACRGNTKSCTAGTGSRVYALWMSCDRGQVEDRCWKVSTAEAMWQVPLDRIKDRIAEQIVNISVPRIMDEIAADVQVTPQSVRSWS